MTSHGTGVQPRRAARGAAAAGLSLLLPGAGQLFAGHRRLGGAMIGVSLAMIAAAVWIVRDAPGWALAMLVHPSGGTWFLLLNAAVLVYRSAAVVHAYVAGFRAPDRVTGAWNGADVAVACTVVAALLVAVAAPQLTAGRMVSRSQDVLATVFVDDQLPMALDAASPGALPHPSVTKISDPELLDLPVIEEPEPEPLPPPPPNPWVEEGRLTVAVIGSDLGPGRASARTDAMLVVSIDTRTGDGAIFSVDRYFRDFPVPSRFAAVHEEHCATGGAWNAINAIYTCATRRVPDRFAALYPESSDPGAAAVAETLGLLLGIDVHHYALVDMGGFVRVVDALGGVEVHLAEPIRVRISPAHEGTDWRTFDMPAGRQHMDGETALAFVRMRDPGDAPRMRRQRCLLSSVVERADVGSVLRGFDEITAAIEEHVATDIPLSSFPDLLQVLTRVEHDRLVGVGIGPPNYRGEGHAPELDRIRHRVRQVLDDPEAAIEQGRTTEAADTICH